MWKANINQFITTQGGTSCKHGDIRKKKKLNHNHVKKRDRNHIDNTDSSWSEKPTRAFNSGELKILTFLLQVIAKNFFRLPLFFLIFYLNNSNPPKNKECFKYVLHWMKMQAQWFWRQIHNVTNGQANIWMMTWEQKISQLIQDQETLSNSTLTFFYIGWQL